MSPPVIPVSPAATTTTATVGADSPMTIDFFVPHPSNAKYVAGTPGNDVFDGSDLPECFAAGGGYDRINGGGAVDSVELRDSHAAYTLAVGSGAGSEIVSSRAVPGDVVALINVERLQFTDCAVALDTGGAAEEPLEAAYVALAETLHVAYFGRPAEHYALESMVARLKSAQAPLGGTADFLAAAKPGSELGMLLDGLAGSAESAALYKGDSGQFVGAIYQQLLGRSADAGGLSYWAEAIDSGQLSRSAAVLSILDGAERLGGGDAALVHNRVLAAINFNLAQDTAGAYFSYATGNFVELTRAMLGKVDQHTNVLAFEGTVLDTLQKIVDGPHNIAYLHEAVALELVGVVQAPWAI
jgi:hypothetical protein